MMQSPLATSHHHTRRLSLTGLKKAVIAYQGVLMTQTRFSHNESQQPCNTHDESDGYEGLILIAQNARLCITHPWQKVGRLISQWFYVLFLTCTQLQCSNYQCGEKLRKMLHGQLGFMINIAEWVLTSVRNKHQNQNLLWYIMPKSAN